MTRALPVFILCSSLCSGQAPSANTTTLTRFNEAVQELIGRVAPSVVQILVTGYGPQANTDPRNTDVTIGRQRSIGSGFVIGAEGYIMTNAHVVNGAERIQVVLPASNSALSKDGQPKQLLVKETIAKQAINNALSTRMTIVSARVIGVARDLDIALLKVDGTVPPALPLAPYRDLRQGEMVFAFGSPEGLRNTVTQGVVSAVARQTDPDSPQIAIQTDAPINPGNSGGPLINVKGEVVGMDTFILSKSGGNEGLGFAIPSATLRVAYRQLKMYGTLRRQEIGISIQTITPGMAAGLKLAQDYGVIISDVLPESPAEKAGLKAGDVLVSIDGQPCENLPTVSYYFLLRDTGDKMLVDVLRGTETRRYPVPVMEEKREIDGALSLATPEKNQVPQIGILGVEIDKEIAKMLPQLRHTYGVIVAAKTNTAARDMPLLSGDIIVAVNDFPTVTLNSLRLALKELDQSKPFVLQIEREGKIMYVTYALE
jgi:serine protease Do